MPARGDLDRDCIFDLHARELARFRVARPARLATLEPARSHVPNGTPMSWMVADAYEHTSTLGATRTATCRRTPSCWRRWPA